MKVGRIRTGRAWLCTILSMLMLLTAMWSAAPTVAAQAASGIQLKKTKLYLYEDQKTTLKLTKSTKKELVWSSSNTKVVKVSQKGTVKAVASGTATVTVKVKGTKQKATCKVKVGKYATGMKLTSAANVVLKVGETSQITTTISPAKVLSKNSTYLSSDENVALVSESGEITAVGEGLAVITVTSKAATKKGKKLEKKVQIFVTPADEEAEEDSTQSGQEADDKGTSTDTDGNTGETSGSDSTSGGSTGGSTGGSSGGNSGGSTGGGNAGSSGSVSGPLLDTQVSGTQKVYTLNKNYSEQVTATISVNGQKWTQQGSVSSVLDQLENTWATKENSAGTLQVSRPVGEEWWTVTDLETNAVLFRVKAVGSGSGSESGQIIVEQVSGTVDVTIR